MNSIDKRGGYPTKAAWPFGPFQEIDMFPSASPALPRMHFAFAVSWLARLLHRVAMGLAERHRQAVAYRELRLLDEHTLRDIGLSHRVAAEWPRARHDVW